MEMSETRSSASCKIPGARKSGISEERMLHGVFGSENELQESTEWNLPLFASSGDQRHLGIRQTK